MYEALNDRVIAEVIEQEQTTGSGIILATNDRACVRYRVVHTNEQTKELQDRIVYAEARYQNHQLPEAGAQGQTYVVIPLKEILAVKA